MKIVWIDVETTGLDFEEDRIIELAALYEDTSLDYEKHGKKAKAVFHKYCQPCDEKPDEWDMPLKGRKETITELTGITWEQLVTQGVDDATLYAEFYHFLADRINPRDTQDKAVFAAYNAKFDNQMIRSLWTRNKDTYFGSFFLSCSLDILSTVALAISRGAMQPLKKHDLSTVCAELDIDVKAHSAMSDIKASRDVELTLEKMIGICHDENSCL